MQEVKIKNNVMETSIYFEDLPTSSIIPDSHINLLIQDLEKDISTYVEKKDARKKYRIKKQSEDNKTDNAHPP